MAFLSPCGDCIASLINHLEVWLVIRCLATLQFFTLKFKDCFPSFRQHMYSRTLCSEASMQSGKAQGGKMPEGVAAVHTRHSNFQILSYKYFFFIKSNNYNYCNAYK